MIWKNAFRTLLAVGIGALAPAARGDEAPAGKLEELSPKIRAVLQLGWNDGALCLDREHWEKPFRGKTAEQVTEEIKNRLVAQFGFQEKDAARQAQMSVGDPKVKLLLSDLRGAAGGAGGGGGGGDSWEENFCGGGVSGLVRIVGTGKEFKVLMQEETAPRRTIDVTDDGQGSLRIVLIDPQKDRDLLFRQENDGKFSLLVNVEGKCHRFTGNSFLEFYRKNRETAERLLFGFGDSLGIGAPPTFSAPEVVEAVCARLRPLDPKQVQRGERLLKQLSDDDLETREKAAAALEKEFLLYRNMIEKEQKRSNLAPEASTRLESILARQGDRGQLDRFVVAVIKDPEALEAMREKAAGADRAAVEARLKQLKDQKSEVK